MNYISRLYKIQNVRLFLIYVIFAGFATLVDLGILFSLTESLHIWYLYSAAFSYFAGMVVNYSLNKHLNFRNKSTRTIAQFGIFATVALIGFGLNQSILYYLVEFGNLWYMHAKIISVLIVMFWSFVGHSKFTFGWLK